jgi:hypothetical protein
MTRSGLNMQNITFERLVSMKRPQLWELCRQFKVKKYPSNAKCVQHLWVKMQQMAEQIVVEATVLCDCDGDITQPWVVLVQGEIKQRFNTQIKAYKWAVQHYVTVANRGDQVSFEKVCMC